MQRIDQLTDLPSWLRLWDSMRTLLRAIGTPFGSPVGLRKQKANGSESKSQTTASLKIAGYTLVLMDPDGQVIWTREWDPGGVFEFRPHQRLWVSCGFTNHSERETEVAEYEVELTGEDGSVVERFSDSFGDSVVVPPGESKQFPAEWRL